MNSFCVSSTSICFGGVGGRSKFSCLSYYQSRNLNPHRHWRSALVEKQACTVVTHSPVNCTSVLYIPNMSYHVMPLTRNTNNALLTEECRTEWCNLIRMMFILYLYSKRRRRQVPYFIHCSILVQYELLKDAITSSTLSNNSFSYNQLQ